MKEKQTLDQILKKQDTLCNVKVQTGTICPYTRSYESIKCDHLSKYNICNFAPDLINITITYKVPNK